MLTTHNKFWGWIADNCDKPAVVAFFSLVFPRVFFSNFLRNNERKRGLGREKMFLTISFDCDYPQDVEVLPQTVRILSHYGISASFACVGYWIEKYPSEHKVILDTGNEVINHTYSHPDNELLNPGRRFKTIPRHEKMEEITRCHETCVKVLGYSPNGCRIPHFKTLFTPDIYEILKDVGYAFSSSTTMMNTKTFGFPFRTTNGIIEIPLTTCPMHPFTVFDTWHSFNSPKLFYRLGHRTEDDYAVLFKFLIDLGIETGSYINIYLDPFDAITKMKRFDELLRYIHNRRDDIEVVTYNQLITKCRTL